RRLARRRTQPPGPFREIVGRMQPVDGRFPAIAVDEVVPVRNQVAERTALMAEGNAAVHAARALFARRRFGRGEIDLAPVLEPLIDRPRLRLDPIELQKSRDLTHAPPRRARRTP